METAGVAYCRRETTLYEKKNTFFPAACEKILYYMRLPLSRFDNDKNIIIQQYIYTSMRGESDYSHMWEAFCPFHGSAPLRHSFSLSLSIELARPVLSVAAAAVSRYVGPGDRSPPPRPSFLPVQSSRHCRRRPNSCLFTGNKLSLFSHRSSSTVLFFRFLSLPSFSFLFSLHTHTHTLNLSHHLNNMAVIVFSVAQGRRPSHARHTL